MLFRSSIAFGVDMFDCVMPTRNARHGLIFTLDGILNIKNEKWKNDFSPLDASGKSYVDNEYSKSYVRHLFSSNELLGSMIASVHNLAFYLDLVEEARQQIKSGTFSNWKSKLVGQLSRRL